MSEKRFIRDGKYVFDTERETVLDIDLICILLNRFADENEQLRQSYKYADELIEEIREIFQKNGVESGYNKVILESLFFSARENEQLRKELEKLKLLNESLGLFMNE